MEVSSQRKLVKPARSFTPEPATTRLRRKCGCGGRAGVGGDCEECDKKRLSMQRHSANSAGSPVVPPVVHDVLHSQGQPLDNETRALMEPRFGHSFGHVRIHADARAAESAQAVNALAYTVGRDVVFGAGQYKPGTARGDRLLAHELTHVVQQESGTAGPQPKVSGKQGALAIAPADARAEAEADAIADRVQSVEPGPIMVQRQPEQFLYREVDRQGGESGDWMEGVSCNVHEMFDDEAVFSGHVPPWGCCADVALAEIDAHKVTAGQHIDRTIERMNSRANMDAAITSHFGSGRLWAYDRIRDNLGKIRTALNGTLEFLCRPENSPGLNCDFTVEASANTNAPITLCISMMGQPGSRYVKGGWVTIMHEVVHVSGVGDLPGRPEHDGSATPEQIARGEVETYRGETGTYAYAGAYSLRNADSYARFVEEVGSADWSAESRPASSHVPIPTVTAGIGLTASGVQPVIAARLTATPFGRGLRFVEPTLGIAGIWTPTLGVIPEGGGERTNVLDRGYVGGEIGFRVGTSGPTAFVFDMGAGTGAQLPGGGAPPEWMLSARVSPSVRFGSPSFGGSLGVDLQRIFNFATPLEEGWIFGITGGIQFGGTSARPR